MNQTYPLLESEESTISLGNVLHIYWLRRQIFLSVFILLVVVSTIILFQVTPKYTASTKILIGMPSSEIVNVKAVLDGELAAIKTEIEILTSRNLAKKVIHQYNLHHLVEFNPLLNEKGYFSFLNPKNWFSDDALETLDVIVRHRSEEEKQQYILTIATDIFLKKLAVKSVTDSQVIKISFESEDSNLSAKITNALSDIYINSQLQAKLDATKQASSWLSHQLSELRNKVKVSDKAIELYREKYGITREISNIEVLAEQLSEINYQIIIAKAEQAEAEIRLRQINRLLKSDSNVETTSEILSSTLIQKLKEQESEVIRKMSEMSVELGSKHPAMIRIKAEIRDLQGRIRAEIKKIASGLQKEAEVARIREHSLQNGLADLTRKMNTRGKASVQLRVLQREANANKVLFNNFLNRFKETSSTLNIQEADARVISLAETPLKVSFPKKGRFFVFINILSFLISSAVIFLIEIINHGFRTPEDIEQTTGHLAIGLIPLIKSDPFEYVLDKPHSDLAESLNSLHISLALSNPDNKIKTVQITSSVPEEGKSTLALCLARFVANAGQKVLLVDTDFRRSTITEKLGISKKHQGLTNLVVLNQKLNISEFIFKDPLTELKIMPKGTAKYTNPSDVFTSKRMKTLVTQLKTHFDLIIFDTPPVMVVADALALAQQIDKTIFTIRWNRTPRKVVTAALLQLERVAENNVTGIVLQRVNLKQHGSYGGSGYYYHYGKYNQYYSS